MLATSDRFLGSLIGAYIGNHFDCVQNGQPLPQHWSALDFVSVPQTWWSLSIDTAQCLHHFSDTGGSFSMLLWMLLHHDNYATRHHAIMRNLSSQLLGSEADSLPYLGGVHLLSDCLEWFIQTSPTLKHPGSSLREYLGHRCSVYPAVIAADVADLLTDLGCIDFLRLKTLGSGSAIDILAAVQLCLNYRENLALALTSNPIKPFVSMLVGYFLGAWVGTAVIPMQWMMAVSPDVMDTLTSAGDDVYRMWAGIADAADLCDVFPLAL